MATEVVRRELKDEVGDRVTVADVAGLVVGGNDRRLPPTAAEKAWRWLAVAGAVQDPGDRNFAIVTP